MGDVASWWKEKKEAEARWRKERAYEASMENLAKARASERYHPPRPWRSRQEMLMIQRLALQWWTCRGSKPSCRAWAREKLGVRC